MLEDLLMLKLIIYVLIIVVLVLAVRFLWSVPSSLRSIANCLWSFYDTYLDKRICDIEDDFDDDETFP